MASLKCLLLFGVLVLPAWAQLFGPSPQFDLRADPPSPATHVVAGYLSAARHSNQAVGIGHRYFYDDVSRTYYGYDMVFEQQPGDRYLVAYYDLSIGPLDFIEGPAGPIDPTTWKKLPLPTPPAPRTIKMSEVAENVVFVDPSTGQRLIDSMYIAPGQANSSRILILNQFRTMNAVRVAFRGAATPWADDFTIPSMPGTARDFSIDDAHMSIHQARVTINDVRQTLSSPFRSVSGTLIWFYLPKHGRYILSLSPRPELGFVKAGEIRGGLVSFTLGEERIKLESPPEIAPGNAPYFLYVLRDPDWEPTSPTTGGTLLTGSVSALELVALARK